MYGYSKWNGRCSVQKKFQVRKDFLSKNNWVGLTLGGLKIVGLKFSWVVVSCLKRFFVKKKNW